MKRIIGYVLIFPLCFLSISLFGQVGPPAMAMPDDDNTVLIDKIIEITKHEKYFTDYCYKKIENFAHQNNWPEQKTKTILESVKFEYYNSTIYNSYAFYSKEQLTKLIEVLTLLNKETKNNMPMILTNVMMQSNLDLFVESVIKGKYVTQH